ncbi:MAG: hypothetical protein HRF40_11455 [Nitrososphaera sp.]|jgi:DNA polymerase elongation subunit (family B)
MTTAVGSLPKPNDDRIPQAAVDKLHDIGFKLVALGAGGRPVAKWSHSYEHPEDIHPDKLTEDGSAIKGIATIFGRTRLVGPNGKHYYLCGFDCDSENVAKIFTSPIAPKSKLSSELARMLFESASLKPDSVTADILAMLSSSGETAQFSLLDALRRITYVTKSRKPYGFHFYWLEEKLFPAIHSRDCEHGYGFEIKTNKSSSALTLPPSTHRDDAGFTYSAIGRTDRIVPLNGLYLFLAGTILAPYLISERKKTEIRALTGDGAIVNSSAVGDRTITGTSRTSAGQNERDHGAVSNSGSRFKVLSRQKEEKIVSYILPSYRQGYRDEICFPLSGALFMCDISQPSAENIVAALCDYTDDLEKQQRLAVVQNTYKNGISGKAVAGTGALVQILAHVNGDPHAAYEIVSNIMKIIYAPEPKAAKPDSAAKNAVARAAAPTATEDCASTTPIADAMTKYQQLVLNSPAMRDNPVQFCLASIVKEARQEDLLAKQLFIAMLSAYTNNPLNMCINAPSGEGKNYVINKVAEKFPSDDVLHLVGMTDKALFHRRGVLVVKNPETKEYEPLMPKIAEINGAIAEKTKRLHELVEKKKAGVSRAASSSKNSIDQSRVADNTAGHEEDKNHAGNADSENGQARGLENEILDLKNQRTELFSQAKKMISLKNKILLFLDTPSPTLLSQLMPLLSHDKYEVEYEFVDTYDGIETRSNVLRGWPAVIFAQALDITRDRRYPEIQRRFITTNPKMAPKKYQEAIDLIASRHGLPDVAYQAEVVSDAEKKTVRLVIEALKQALLEFNGGQEPGKNNVLIPYHGVVSRSLPGQKAFDMTTAYRLFTYLSLLPVIYKDRRPKLVATPVPEGDDANHQDVAGSDTRAAGVVVVPFAIFDDLREAISLMEYGDGTKPYVLEWYHEVFLPAYERKKNPDFKINKKTNQTIEESRIAVTTEQLKEPTKQYTGRDLSTQQLLERYIYPLHNIGYIDSKDSEINGKAKIYWPILSSGNIRLFEKGESNNDAKYLKLHLGKNAQFPDKNYLISVIWRTAGHYSDKGYSVAILDHDGRQVTIEQLVERYYSHPEDYFHKTDDSHDDRAPCDNASGDSKDNRVKIEGGYGASSEAGSGVCNHALAGVAQQNTGHKEQVARTRDAQHSHTHSIPTEEITKSESEVSTKSFAGAKTNIRISALDLEWRRGDDKNGAMLFAAGFVDNLGWSEALHIADFGNSEAALMQAIVHRFDQLPMLSVGWYTTGQESDLLILHERCVANGIVSPVDISSSLCPSIKGKTHIDLYRIFDKELVKSSIFENKYRSLKLEDVAQALLEKGKHRGITGATVEGESVSTQKQYVLQDAQLALELAQVNDGQVLDLMQAISELIELDFEHVCHTGLSNWWAHVFDKMGCTRPAFELQLTDGSRYEGGLVLEPRLGNYDNVRVVDVASLYPTVAISYNISFDTVNCGCCRDVPSAKVVLGDETIDPKGYWICQRKQGAFPSKLSGYREERLKQKKLGNKIKDRGLKILINAGYGVFAYPGFKYYDKRVAELVTAYGRYTLRHMQTLAKEYGFETCAGDTDSLFLSAGSDESLQRFIDRCQQELGVEVEHQRTFRKFLNIKKKHYIGIDSSTGQPVVKGMEGKKSDRPRWVTRTFDQLVQDFRDGVDPTINIKRAIDDLESRRVAPDDLKICVTLSKDPAEYATNTIQKRVGLHVGAKKGDVICFYKSMPNGNKDAIPVNPEDISVSEYKKALFATLKDPLVILGHGSEDSIALSIFKIDHGTTRKKSRRIGKASREQGVEVGDAHA